MAINADGRVIIDTQLNNQGFTKGIKNLKGQLGGLNSVVGRLGTVIASAFAVKTLVNFGKECIELGSNVAEVQNVVDTAFGDMRYKVEAFASSAITNFGMSQLAAKKTASTYMAMAKGMGISDDAASDMAITLAGLTGDVASFYNISQELADIKLKSVFTGETETLKELGVVMTQDNLKAYALTKGITKSYDAMTQAEKVALRYNFVMDSLALAQGDFAKTSDSWANQTRILSMQWQEFMSILGGSLTQVLLPAIKMLNSFASGLISVANAISATLSSVFGTAGGQLKQAAASASAIGDATAGAVDNQNALTSAVEKTAKAEQKSLAGFDEINKLTGEAAGGASSGASIGAGTISTFTVDEASAATTGSTIKWLEDILEELGETIDDLRPAGEWLWEHLLQPMTEWTGETFIEALNQVVDLLGDMGSLLSGELSFSDFVTQLTPVQTALLSISTALVAIKLASLGLTGLGALTTFIGTVKALKATSLIGKLAEVFLLTAQGAGTLHEAMQLVFGKGSIIAGIGAVVGGATLTITNFIKMLENGFSWANEALMVLGIAITALGAVILGVPGLVAGVVAGVVAAIATAVVLIKEHWTEIKEFFKGVINGMIDFVEGFGIAFVRMINAVIDALNKLSFDVPDWVPGIGGKTWGFHLTRLVEPSIPRLAKGAVIPPNREFLAVLGDQKHGTNIEAPLETIVQAFNAALRQNRGIGGGKPTTVILECDKRQLGKVILDLFNMESQRVGVALGGDL